MSESSIRVPVVRVRRERREESTDLTAAEVPLEVRVQGKPLAVIMRTPGADLALAAGFLLGERLIRCADDIDLVEHCTIAPGDSADGNTLGVTLNRAAYERAGASLASRRDVMANSSCGVCGRSTVDSLLNDLRPLDTHARMSTAVAGGLPIALRERQPLFESTGGHHAAGVFDLAGHPIAVAEDVGRHNAVDKVIGRLLLEDRLPLSTAALCVSGRTSFEIVQKAWCAGIPIVASVSAPSSLAVSLAGDAGITLIGFVRGGGFNIYTSPVRIVEDLV
jgi:FdhD protein